MTPRQLELALKRQRLEFQVAAQRRELAEAVQPFMPVISVVDGVHRGFHYLKTHPEISAVAAVVVFILRPSRALRWARHGFSAWRLWGNLRRRLNGA
jgi:hypothetical protein